MRLRFLSILGFFSAIPSSASALAIDSIKTVLIRCDYCTNAQQAEQFARNVYFKDLLVINPSQDESRWKFAVQTQVARKACATPHAETGTGTGADSGLGNAGKAPQSTAAPARAAENCANVRVGVERALNAREQGLADKFRAAYVYTGGRMSTAPINISISALNIPPSVYNGPLSAATLANNINVRDYVTGRLPKIAGEIPAVKSNPLGVLVDAINAAGEAQIFVVSDAQVTLKINFADASYVAALFSTASTVASIKGAVDSDGRTVMTRSNMNEFAGFTQIYSSAQALDSFVRNAESLFVPITDGKVAGSLRASCTIDQPSRKLRCVKAH
jgi:hypothetical protein